MCQNYALRRVFTSISDANTGYYGSTCQTMRHICDGNPCKNGATCVRGDTYTAYTCTCKTGNNNKLLSLSICIYFHCLLPVLHIKVTLTALCNKEFTSI